MKKFILEHYKQNNYPLDKLIICSIRNNENSKIDMFNDWHMVIYEDKLSVAKGTTDPGVYYTYHPLNKNGAFHLDLGFHEKIWTPDKHKGKYFALCNRSNCNPQRGWRDKNKNFKNDDKIKVYDHVGANFHYANHKELIKYSSAGCIVTPDILFFNKLMQNVIASEQELFSYFIFNIKDVPTNLISELSNYGQ